MNKRMDFKPIIALLMVALQVATIQSLTVTTTVSEVLELLKKHYDKRDLPRDEKRPVHVECSAHIIDMFNIDEMNHEFTADLYLRQWWTDPRLDFISKDVLHQLPFIKLDGASAEFLWTPDLFIPNERDVRLHDFYKENKFLKIHQDGEVLMSTRITVTASCQMNLKWYPFDRQTCVLEFESYGYTMDEVEFSWRGNFPLTVSKNLNFVNLELYGFKNVKSNLAVATGNYSKIAAEFYLKRVPTRYLQDVYFPAIALPIITFITLNVGAYHFRVLLSTICLVGIVIYTALLSVVMPKVSYQTALDFYVFNSSVMILNACIVNFIVYRTRKMNEDRSKKARVRLQPLAPSTGRYDDTEEICADTEPSEDFTMTRPKTLIEKLFRIFQWLCETSKWTMPLFFIFFNILYWIVVLAASSSFPEDAILFDKRY